MSHIVSKSFLKFSFILLFYSKQFQSQQRDYWSGDFDLNKNCENEDEIMKLRKTDPHQCHKVFIKNGEEKAFRNCKTHLAIKLQKQCDFSKVANSGLLLYCKNRAAIVCCFREATCSSWNDIQNTIYKKAKEYLKDPKDVLKNLVKNDGYKTCHNLQDSLDVTKCAEDCQRMKEEKFSKNCTSGGGLFKCCIRRDNRGCNECRFCCQEEKMTPILMD